MTPAVMLFNFLILVYQQPLPQLEPNLKIHNFIPPLDLLGDYYIGLLVP